MHRDGDGGFRVTCERVATVEHTILVRFPLSVEQARDHALFTSNGKVTNQTDVIKSRLSRNRSISDSSAFLNDVFVKREGKPEVYMIFKNGQSYCHVENESQLAANRAGTKVHPLPADFDLDSGRRFLGKCGWPNGVFRRSNENQVFVLYDNEYLCHLNEEWLWRAGAGGPVLTIVADPNSDLARGREHKGTCPQRW